MCQTVRLHGNAFIPSLPSLSSFLLSSFLSFLFFLSFSPCALIWVLSTQVWLCTHWLHVSDREDYAWWGKKWEKRTFQGMEKKCERKRQNISKESVKHSRLLLSFVMQPLTFCHKHFQMNRSSWNSNWWHATLSLTFAETLVATN